MACPTCRGLDVNSLIGTLPNSLGSLNNLTSLYVIMVVVEIDAWVIPFATCNTLGGRYVPPDTFVGLHCGHAVCRRLCVCVGIRTIDSMNALPTPGFIESNLCNQHRPRRFRT